MIDLHIHLLPGVDDGARDLDESVEMARLAASDGCQILVVTPHQRHEQWWNDDRAALESLRIAVQDRLGPSPRILLGGEIRVDAGVLDELDNFGSSGVMSLAGSRYLLLEFDRSGVGPDPDWFIHEVTVAGWSPIIAHPEFMQPMERGIEPFRVLTEHGALLQVTAQSITGEFGKKIQRFTADLLDAGLAHFVASDAHGVDWRPPGLREAFRTIAGRWGVETAGRLLIDNPLAVVEDRSIG